MDLLFSKYASPYIFLSEVLELNRLREFVYSVAEMENDKKMWDIYIALVSNPYAEVKSFEEFKKAHSVRTVDEYINLEEVVKNSFDVLQNFNPKTGGET